MAVLIDIDSHEHHLLSRVPSGGACAMASSGKRVDCLDIGLINNMSDSALMSTERQLFDLLDAAAGRLFVRLHFYTMEATPRSEWGRDYVRRYYRVVGVFLSGRPWGRPAHGRRCAPQAADQMLRCLCSNKDGTSSFDARCAEDLQNSARPVER